MIPELGYGLGLRSPHWEEITSTLPEEVAWFEIISENFMDTQGHARQVLEKVREHYPVAMHGVSLSIGSSDPLDRGYLTKLKTLANWLEPAWMSDHICWTGIHQVNTHDLLPVPYTEDSLVNMVAKVKQAQDYLGRQLVLENPSNYLEFSANSMSEAEFIIRLLEEADCLLLLDVNNVYVTSFNHRLDAKAYIEAMPAERIAQIHLAGHEHRGSHIIDTHDGRPTEDVLALYHHTIQTHGFKNTMLEWDAKIPAFSVMLETLQQVKSATDATFHPAYETIRYKANATEAYDRLMDRFQSHILQPFDAVPPAHEWIREKEHFPAKEQLNVYQLGYRTRLFQAIIEVFPATRHLAGEKPFDTLVRNYIEHTPSHFYSLDDYIAQALPFFEDHLPIAPFELATLELTIRMIQMQPQPDPVTLQDLATIPPDQFLSRNLRLLPSVQLLSFTHDVYSAYGQWLEKKVIDKVEQTPCHMMLHAVGEDVYRSAPSEEDYRMLKVIHEGETLEEVLHQLHTAHHVPQDQLLETLQTHLHSHVPQSVYRLRLKSEPSC